MSDPVTAAADGSPDPRSGMVAALDRVELAVLIGRLNPRTRHVYIDGNDACQTIADAVIEYVAAAFVPTVERLVAEGKNDGVRLAAQLVRDHVLGESGARVANFLDSRADRAAVVREGDDR